MLLSSRASLVVLDLSRVTLRRIRLPLKAPFEISSGRVNDRSITLVTVESSDGAVGWGECVAGETPNYSSETVHSTWHAMREWVVPRVLRADVTRARDIHAVVQRDFRGNLMAKAAIEMACWDLEARLRDIPLARLLGGVRSEIETGISLGIQPSPDALAAQAAAAVDVGYRRIKLKIKPGTDIDYVEAVRETVGPDVALSVDANGAYCLDDAAHLAQLDRMHLLMIEQPLAAGDLVRHSRLQRELDTPICLDESITCVEDAEDMVTLGSGRIVNIKAGRVGGLASALAIHDFCRDTGVPVWCGGMLESGIGRGHNVALASLPNFSLPGDVSPSARYWERDIVIPEWEMNRGLVTVPNAAGIGVEVDVDRVDTLTTQLETIER